MAIDVTTRRARAATSRSIRNGNTDRARARSPSSTRRTGNSPLSRYPIEQLADRPLFEVSICSSTVTHDHSDLETFSTNLPATASYEDRKKSSSASHASAHPWRYSPRLWLRFRLLPETRRRNRTYPTCGEVADDRASPTRSRSPASSTRTSLLHHTFCRGCSRCNGVIQVLEVARALNMLLILHADNDRTAALHGAHGRTEEPSLRHVSAESALLGHAPREPIRSDG